MSAVLCDTPINEKFRENRVIKLLLIIYDSIIPYSSLRPTHNRYNGHHHNNKVIKIIHKKIVVTTTVMVLLLMMVMMLLVIFLLSCVGSLPQ